MKRLRTCAGRSAAAPSEQEQRPTAEAFVVRLVAPTEAATVRLLEWAAQLAPAGVECWISVDATFPSKRETRGRLRRLEEGGWNRHTYTEQRMLDDFPALHEMLEIEEVADEMHPKAAQRKRSLAWAFHTEALGVWWADVGRRFGQVWVLEDDVGFSGSIADLVAQLRPNGADLVAWMQQPPVSPSWYWFGAASRAFGRRFPKRRRKIREHAIRLSHALLESLCDASSRGQIAWSESSIPTICFGEPRLSFTHLRPHVAQGHYDWNTRVEEEEWCQIAASESPTKRGKLFHALKF